MAANNTYGFPTVCGVNGGDYCSAGLANPCQSLDLGLLGGLMPFTPLVACFIHHPEHGTHIWVTLMLEHLFVSAGRIVERYSGALEFTV